MHKLESFFHYLPVDESVIRSGVYLTGIGRSKIKAGSPYPPAEHPALYQLPWSRGRTLAEFQLILLTDGAGEFEEEHSGTCNFSGPVIIILFPGAWHRYRPNEKSGWTERWISISGEIMHWIARRESSHPHSSLIPFAWNQQFVDRFDCLLHDVHCSPGGNSRQLALKALSLFADAMAIVSVETDSPSRTPHAIAPVTDDEVVNEAVQIIWTRSHTQISVEDIARPLPVSRRTLDRRFSQATGRTVLEEINRCRLSRAKRLLRDTSLEVKTVAYLAGFPDYELLRVSLRANESQTPSEYRRNWAQGGYGE